jgi:hypothetical protein
MVLTIMGATPMSEPSKVRQDWAEIQLEQVLDKMPSLASVVRALVAVCRDKADHLRTNWQDEGTARTWEKDADKLQAVANRLEN